MSLSKIKSVIIFGGISLCLVFFPVSAISQLNLNPDSTFHGTSDAPWYSDGTNIIGAQGEIFVITYKQNYPDTRAYGVYVYTINHAGKLASYKMGSKGFNYFYYGFPYEGTYYEGIQGNSIAFLFNGQLWHYINQMEYSASPLIDPPVDSYDCFAMIPIPNTGEPKTYFNHITGAPDVIKKGAFQHDSTLYFLGVYAKSSDPNYKKWCVQKYTYNKVQNKFYYSLTIPVTNIYGDNFGGVVEHIDASGNHRLILNTYIRGGNPALGFLDIGTSGGEVTFTYTKQPGELVDPCVASTVVGGSIKGCRTSNLVNYKEYPERFTLFYLKSDHTLAYCENYFWFGNWVPSVASSGSVVLASSLAPYPVDKVYNIQGTFELIPTMFHTNVNQSPDGFRQQNWVYYPDKNGKICGARFLSDSWQFLPDSTVSSTDLANDSIYGPQVRSLWTLTGIVDGGPPCSIDWPVWTNHHLSTTKPTSLDFVQTSLSKTEVTTTSEDQYTLGANFKTDFKHFNFGLEGKFSDVFKNTVSKSTTIKTEITKTYELNEEGQELGYYLYSVPSITRYMYQVYPWWDNGLDYPVPNTVQFRFVVTGMALLNRSREISLFPFLVDEPNSTDLADWKHSGRTNHQNDLLSSGLKPVCTPTWSSPNPGDIGTFEKITDSITEYEHKTSFSIEATFTGKKPEVFEAGGSAGYEVSYSTSTKNVTEMGTKLEISLHNLTEKSLGVNFSECVLETYWFKPEDYDWWFYDSLGYERPWYIAYLVNSTQGRLNLISPATDEKAQGRGKWFSWAATGFEPVEYQLFLSKSPHISPSSTIMRLYTGASTEYCIPELPSDLEKLYWAVMAVTAEGEIVWSESRSLILLKEESPDFQNYTLTAFPYPNPVNGRGIHLFVDTEEKGEMLVRIMTVNGSQVYESVLDHPAEGPQTYVLPQMNLARGLYIMEITIKNERAIKKLMVF